jgi:hypothetical protein
MGALHVTYLGGMTVTFIMSERQTRGDLDAFELIGLGISEPGEMLVFDQI